MISSTSTLSSVILDHSTSDQINSTGCLGGLLEASSSSNAPIFTDESIRFLDASLPSTSSLPNTADLVNEGKLVQDDATDFKLQPSLVVSLQDPQASAASSKPLGPVTRDSKKKIVTRSQKSTRTSSGNKV